MPLTFRNITTSPDDPVDTWPSEAIVTAMERGDLVYLALLASAIDADPWGRTARQIEEALGHTRPYGVAELMTEAIRRARRRSEESERAAVADALRDLVSRSGLSRAEFASRLGTSRSRLSTYLNGKVIPSAALMVRAQRVSTSGIGSADDAPGRRRMAPARPGQA
ncbi:MAG: helix-turn-helix transcriptional regulator [Geodermatophilaceae bacterium]|nr:helix-turn-helix transcriptional regulator [Geodermatophilaceae bacterium]